MKMRHKLKYQKYLNIYSINDNWIKKVELRQEQNDSLPFYFYITFIESFLNIFFVFEWNCFISDKNDRIEHLILQKHPQKLCYALH